MVLAADLHGHSRKKNVFIYGCTGRPGLRERVFPKIMEGNCDIFSYSDCVFGLQKSKEGTGRIVLYK